MTTAFARAIEGIPVVGSTTERDSLFPLPQTDQRVQLRATGELQRYTGVQWVSDHGTPLGRTVATLSQYLANNAVFNVKDGFNGLPGAVGDGVTDDTAAILACIAAARATGITRPATGDAPAGLSKLYLSYGGATILFPAARYKVTPLIGDFSNLTFRSGGKNAAVLDGSAYTGVAGAIINGINNTGDTRVINFNIDGVEVWGPVTGSVPCISLVQGFGNHLSNVVTSWGQYGIAIEGSGSQIVLDHCQVEQATVDGFRVFGGMTGLNVAIVDIRNSTARNCGRDGFSLLQGTTDCHLDDNQAYTCGRNGLRLYSDQQAGSVHENHYVRGFTSDQCQAVGIYIAGTRWTHVERLWSSNWTSATSNTLHHSMHFQNCISLFLDGLNSYGGKADAVRIEGCTTVLVDGVLADDYNQVGFNVINSTDVAFDNVTTQRTGFVAANLPAGNGVVNYGIVVDNLSSRVRPGANIEARYGALARYNFSNASALMPKARTNGMYRQPVPGLLPAFALPATATVGNLIVQNQNVSGEVLVRYQITTNAAQQTMTGTLRLAFARQAGVSTATNVSHAIAQLGLNATGAEAITATFGVTVTGGAAAQQTVAITCALSSTVGVTAYGKFEFDLLFGLNNNTDSPAAEVYAALTTN
jgi:hypothetical protein